MQIGRDLGRKLATILIYLNPHGIQVKPIHPICELIFYINPPVELECSETSLGI